MNGKAFKDMYVVAWVFGVSVGRAIAGRRDIDAKTLAANARENVAAIEGEIARLSDEKVRK